MAFFAGDTVRAIFSKFFVSECSATNKIVQATKTNENLLVLNLLTFYILTDKTFQTPQYSSGRK